MTTSGDLDTLTLRAADPRDKEFAYQVKEAALREYVEQAGGWDDAEQRGLHDRRFRADDFHVIILDGIDIGVLCSVPERDCVYLYQLYILPEHQGRGAGSACLSLVIEWGNERGLPVRLRVLKVNSRASALYERLGFARVGDTPTHHLMERSPGVAPRSSESARGDVGRPPAPQGQGEGVMSARL